MIDNSFFIPGTYRLTSTSNGNVIGQGPLYVDVDHVKAAELFGADYTLACSMGTPDVEIKKQRCTISTHAPHSEFPDVMGIRVLYTAFRL